MTDNAYLHQIVAIFCAMSVALWGIMEFSWSYVSGYPSWAVYAAVGAVVMGLLGIDQAERGWPAAFDAMQGESR